MLTYYRSCSSGNPFFPHLPMKRLALWRPKAFPLFPVQDTLAGDVMTERATFTSGIHDCAAPSIACVRNRIGTELSSTHSIAPSLQTSSHSAQAALFLGKRTPQNTTNDQKTALRCICSLCYCTETVRLFSNRAAPAKLLLGWSSYGEQNLEIEKLKESLFRDCCPGEQMKSKALKQYGIIWSCSLWTTGSSRLTSQSHQRLWWTTCLLSKEISRSGGFRCDC